MIRKKTQLLLLVIFPLFGVSQILESENFESLTVGNIGTDITGSSVGQGGYYTEENSGDNASFKVIDIGGSHGKVAQMINSRTDTKLMHMWKGGLESSWNSRTTGNNVVSVEVDFNTGDTDLSRWGTFNLNDQGSFNTIMGFRFRFNSNELSAIHTSGPGTTTDIYTDLAKVSDGSPMPTIPDNTWVHLQLQYDSSTGVAEYLVEFNSEVYHVSSTINVSANRVPRSFMVSSIGFEFSDSTPTEIVFDNTKVEAVGTLSSFAIQSQDDVLVYQNANELVINNANQIGINSLELFDLKGRSLVRKDRETDRMSLEGLTKGVYLLMAFTDKGNFVKKFVRK